jgi:myo-inositol-1(or 4)-monophosphatase
MNDQLLSQALESAKSAAQQAGRKLLPHFGEVKSKIKPGDTRSMRNIMGGAITELDGQTEEFLRGRLSEFARDNHLDVGFRGEESAGKVAGLTWLVDPIDGTTHFVRGLAMATVQIALVKDGDVLVGVIHDIADQSTYWASREQGAFQDEKRLSVSARSLNQSLVELESHLENPENLDKFLKLRDRTVVVQALPSGYTLAMVASGKFDGKIALEPYGKDWDFAPGSLLVAEAGGVARNLGSPGFDYRNHDFIISNPVIYKELTEGPEAIFE